MKALWKVLHHLMGTGASCGAMPNFRERVRADVGFSADYIIGAKWSDLRRKVHVLAVIIEVTSPRWHSGATARCRREVRVGALPGGGVAWFVPDGASAPGIAGAVLMAVFSSQGRRWPALPVDEARW